MASPSKSKKKSASSSRVAGFYLSDEQIVAVELASKQLGVSKSQFVGRLIDAHEARRDGVPEVTVDGVRFVPARGSRS